LTRVRSVLAVLVLGVAGVATAFAIPAIGARSSASSTVTIRVTATEFKFALSRKTVVPGTTVVFKVTNKGKIPHNFKIAGKKTPLIQPGKTATLKVVFRKKGRFGYLCTLAGHAANGMKGTFGVGVKITTTTVTTTGGTTTGGGGGGGSACSTPSTTVNVGMFEYRFDLDKTSVPAGCIQFVITNRGAEQHNFDVQGVKAGAILSPGQSETWAVQLAAGTKQVVCDVPFHIDRGMTASFTVT
jgi:uncharacterized cupredoxin-like copper-binding protein